MLNGHGCLFSRWAVGALCLLSFSAAQAVQPRVLGGVTADTEEAPYLAALLQRSKSLRVADLSYVSQVFSDSNELPFDAPLSYCGYGFEPCEDAEGSVCLIARGTTTFDEKVANCEAGGGVGAIIYNYLPNVFLGAVGRDQALPVVAVSSWTGQQLLESVGESVVYDYSEAVESADFFCGGSYLGEGWVLTAAHCVIDREVADLQVVLGAGDYRDGREQYPVRSIHGHEDFSVLSLGADVALLKLSEVPSEIEGVALVDLASKESAVALGETVSTYGRGEQEVVAAAGASGLSSMSYSASTVDMQLIDRASCQQAMAGDAVEADMLCAGGLPAIGTCFGDSGGPLVLTTDGEPQLIGVVSWGVGCGLAGRYDVFASVANYRSSIQAVMQGSTEVLSGVEFATEVREEPLQELAADAESLNTGEEIPELGVGASSAWLVILLAFKGLRRAGQIRLER